MLPSALINDGYNRQIVLLRQIVTTNINNTSKNINGLNQIRAQYIIRFQFLINILTVQTCRLLPYSLRLDSYDLCSLDSLIFFTEFGKFV